MPTKQYIGPIRLNPNYLQRASMRRIYVKFHQDSYKSDRLVVLQPMDRRALEYTDKRTGLYQLLC